MQAVYVNVDNLDIEESKFTCTLVSEQETACASLALNSDSQRLLKCPDVWISDTGAMQHSTFSTIGGINKRECNVRKKGQMGTTTNTSIVMDFCVKLCNGRGNCLGKVLLKDVQVDSKFNYKLFSINQLLKDWFTLSGNDSMLGLIRTCNKQSMAFDTKIPIDNSFLLAGYMQQVKSNEVAAANAQEPSLSPN